MRRPDPTAARKRQVLAACVVALVLLLSAIAVIGCGSSATTSPAEAKAVAVAEHKFGMANRRGVAAARAQCSKKSGRAAESCYQKRVALQEEKHRVAFRATIEEVLESGVGPECTEALEKALSTVGPALFLGGTASVCQAESRD